MEGDETRERPEAGLAWLVAVRERMRAEVADLLDEQGRLRYEPEAPDAAEAGARILRVFGRAAVDELADALNRRLAEWKAEVGPQAATGGQVEEEFRRGLEAYLRGVLKEVLDEVQRSGVLGKAEGSRPRVPGEEASGGTGTERAGDEKGGGP